jgi:hypothetical protein
VTIKTRIIDRALINKGFSRERDKHHLMYWLHANGKKTSISTRMSHGASEIGDPLIGLMHRQMRISKAEFLSFVSCAMSGAKYLAKMVSEGQVRAP